MIRKLVDCDLDYYAVKLAYKLKVSPGQFRQVPIKVVRYAATCPALSDSILIAFIICRLMANGSARINCNELARLNYVPRRTLTYSINRLRDAGIFYSAKGYTNTRERWQEIYGGKKFSLDFPK